MKTYIIIPARLASNRLANKPLLEVDGKPLLQWTYDRACQAESDKVIVSTSDPEIVDYCKNNGIMCILTSESVLTGTHRCAEVLWTLDQELTEEDYSLDSIVVNWQCDEPLVDPKDIGKLVKATKEFYGISTLVANMEEKHFDDRNTTKAVVGDTGLIHWFSRKHIIGNKAHIGIYAFRSAILRKLGKLRRTKFSTAESLEQLAWLENGFQIGAVGTWDVPLSINTERDFEKFKEMMENN